MSDDSWDDFERPQQQKSKSQEHNDEDLIEEKSGKKQTELAGCDWGFSRQYNKDDKSADQEAAVDDSGLARFIPIYEKYLSDKKSFKETTNSGSYVQDPQKAIREWFNIEGHDFSPVINKPRDGGYTCALDLPIEDQDFALSSTIHTKKQIAIDEVCLTACRLLDACQLLYPDQADSIPTKEETADKKRRIDEAIKEDDIELDNTSKKHCDLSDSSRRLNENKSKAPKVNTYESLLSKWNELNMSILQLKAKLVKLDLSITQHAQSQNTGNSSAKSVSSSSKSRSSECEVGDDDIDEIDPLDEYMSSLETKSKLSMDEKIEKSRLKTQIAAYEREQSEVSRLLALAKPKFDLNKSCLPNSTKSINQQPH